MLRCVHNCLTFDIVDEEIHNCEPQKCVPKLDFLHLPENQNHHRSSPKAHVVHVDGCEVEVHHPGDDGAKLFEQVATSKNPCSHSQLKAKSEDAIQVGGFTAPSPSPSLPS